jgi:hypothetical protein
MWTSVVDTASGENHTPMVADKQPSNRGDGSRVQAEV